MASHQPPAPSGADRSIPWARSPRPHSHVEPGPSLAGPAWHLPARRHCTPAQKGLERTPDMAQRPLGDKTAPLRTTALHVVQFLRNEDHTRGQTHLQPHLPDRRTSCQQLPRSPGPAPCLTHVLTTARFGPDAGTAARFFQGETSPRGLRRDSQGGHPLAVRTAYWHIPVKHHPGGSCHPQPLGTRPRKPHRGIRTERTLGVGTSKAPFVPEWFY